MARPLILVSPHTEREGTELPDAGISVSQRYTDAILAAGGLPVILPCTTDASIVRDAVDRTAGVLLTGGEDVRPSLYATNLPPDLEATVVPAVGNRDLFELILIDETLRHARPLLAICRGQQIVNVALGGDLMVDIPLQLPANAGHNRQARRFEPVHDIDIEAESRLEDIVGTRRLAVNSTHHQAVGRVAPPLRITARSPDGIVEALEFREEARAGTNQPFFLAVQFHPERLCDRYPAHARIFESFVAACAP